MNVLELIKGRRSLRRFTKKVVSDRLVTRILEAARWAPSGLNNQPWRFMVFSGQEKDKLCRFTHYSRIIKNADKLIAVFLDKKASYNYEKDLMAIGACIENMLLYIHSQKLGAVWLGEILNQRKKINRHLALKSDLQLEAVIALGYPRNRLKHGRRKPLRDLIIK